MDSLRILHLQKTAYSLIILVLVVWIMKSGSVILIPLFWAAFFAFALYPVSNWLEEKGFPRAVAIVLTLILITSLAVFLFYSLTDQVIGLIKDIPDIKASFFKKVDLYLEDFGGFIQGGSEMPSASDLLNPRNLEAALYETGRSLVLLGVMPLFIFLMLFYKDFFSEFLRKLSKDGEPRVLIFIKDSGKVIQSYLLGMLLVTIIVSIISGLVFYFLGIKYYLLFAVFIAVMNLIPYVGVIFSSLLLVFYVLLTTDSMFYPLATVFLLWLIQFVENNFITPVVVGGKVRVNAFAVILAILVGGYIWGVSGMILFIPLAGLLKITFERIPSLAAYGYLLGDVYPVIEKRENFYKAFIRLIKQKKRPS
ncbi:AI-2E family transporter [Cecembia rubra]|uniref:Putative PurR-regulated permease PerM n=1 Tax=Cecembia rubra TaxID=1485585 RepID=A0A2P8ECD4_9BACT|nr:AI-2E family transporter [Cecembia rubra]PSL07110.1 putative PurR-regulated permease PerM [Cecembia rubra]